ncbi:MAG: hypothetical protein AAF335_05140, partial [Bacteroidota bacterium]
RHYYDELFNSMEITIKTKDGTHHSGGNKTGTILSALIVGAILLAIIGYGIYHWLNKPQTVFVCVKNKTVSKLLEESALVNQESIDKKGGEEKAERILKRLKQECKQRNLLGKDENIIKEQEEVCTQAIKDAAAAGQAAEKEITDFQEEQQASKNDTEKKKKFHQHVHKIISTSADKKEQDPTDKQIKAAFEQLVENLKDAQTTWDKGKEKDKSYEEIYMICKLAENYMRIKLLLTPAPSAGK